MRRSFLPAISIFTSLFSAAAFAADWPQFRHDAGRTAASSQELPAQLHLQWVRQLPTPAPAFPKNVRLEFDTTYEPVVLGKTMFLPSMITESVTAIDTATGEERWRFFTDAPVRFAPVAWQDKVYFASDDGFLYCLEAANGKLRWKFRGLPLDRKDRMLLGSGRLISLFPARGGPVLHQGIVYFAAGLWPADGVFVHALDATSGNAVWSNVDSNHLAGANEDHGIDQFAGIAPQGYLAVVGDRLVVPCGAQLPAIFDLASGDLAPYYTGWGGRDGLPKGTWFVAGSGRYLCQSGDLYDLSRPNDEKFIDPRGKRDFKSELYTAGLTRLRIDPTNHKDIGAFGQPVITAEALYENNGAVAALDLTSVKLTPFQEANLPANRKDDTYPDDLTGQFRELWRLPSKLEVHIKADDRLFCAGPGTVAAVEIPKLGDQPKIEWQSPIEGTPHRLLAADNRLFVVSQEGRIYAFGSEKPTDLLVHPRPSAPALPDDTWTEKATEILDATKATQGYALVLGLDSGRLVEELVRQSDLHVIAVDKDAAKVAAIRNRLHQTGLYGSRATVHVGDPLTYPLPPCLASLVVSERSRELKTGALRTVGPAIFPKLRPYGGVACLEIASVGDVGSFDAPAGGPFHGLNVRSQGDWVLLRREGPLPGAADWSHEDATAAATGASTDDFVKAPLGLLWFDASKEWHRKPGSALVRVAGGRVLVKDDSLDAIDVFTGRRLWQAALPFKHAATDQLVTAPDAIYLTSDKTCLVFDPATGNQSQRFLLPDDAPGPWLNLRCWDDYLVATSGPSLVCVDRHSGKTLWSHPCNRAALSLAVGAGRAFCAELLNPRRGEKEADDVRTRAIDLRSGEVVWEIPSGSNLLYSEPLDLLVTAGGIYQAADGQLHKPLPGPPKPVDGKPVTNAPGPLFVVGDKLLWGTVESFVVYNLNSGQIEGDRTEWVRRGCTTIRASAHMVTTRVRANAAYIDLDSREATSLWNIRPACLNNLYPANGVFNAPNILGGCTCNYTHTSQAYVPLGEIERAAFGQAKNQP
jgi:outer membrane protein assembly factor BamB